MYLWTKGKKKKNRESPAWTGLAHGMARSLQHVLVLLAMFLIVDGRVCEHSICPLSDGSLNNIEVQTEIARPSFKMFVFVFWGRYQTLSHLCVYAV